MEILSFTAKRFPSPIIRFFTSTSRTFPCSGLGVTSYTVGTTCWVRSRHLELIQKYFHDRLLCSPLLKPLIYEGERVMGGHKRSTAKFCHFTKRVWMRIERVEVMVHSFLFWAVDSGGWSVCNPAALPVPTAREAGWAPGPFWTVLENRKSLALTGTQTRDCQFYSLFTVPTTFSQFKRELSKIWKSRLTENTLHLIYKYLFFHNRRVNNNALHRGTKGWVFQS